MSELKYRISEGKIILSAKEDPDKTLLDKVCEAINKIEETLGIDITDWGR